MRKSIKNSRCVLIKVIIIARNACWKHQSFWKKKIPKSRKNNQNTEKVYILFWKKNPDLQLSLLPRLLSVFILVFTTWTRTFLKVYIKYRIINLIFFIQQFPSDWNIRTKQKIFSLQVLKCKKKMFRNMYTQPCILFTSQ